MHAEPPNDGDDIEARIDVFFYFVADLLVVSEPLVATEKVFQLRAVDPPDSLDVGEAIREIRRLESHVCFLYLVEDLPQQ